ncbi:MAG: hypothetical protein ACOX4G_02870 [Limnochordia bacterium]|jgi:hypothetical protein
MHRMNGVLRHIGEVLGALVIVTGILRFAYAECVACLLIALAIIIGGPLEDVLTRWAVKKGKDDDERQQLARLVDLSTSIGFLICLGLAIWMI